MSVNLKDKFFGCIAGAHIGADNDGTCRGVVQRI